MKKYKINLKNKLSLYDLIYKDTLTNLGNYKYFCKESSKIIEKKNKSPKYIFIIDIEKFRTFNQYYGHEEGKKLIKQLSIKINNIIGNLVKILSRFNNDVFAILLETNENIETIAKKIFKNLRQVEIENKLYNIYPIIGIYKIGLKDDILTALDKALTAHDEIIGDYNTKYKIYDKTNEDNIIEEHKIEEIMESAIQNQEFKIVYQPKIELKTNKVSSCEALVRWYRNGIYISPSKFIPLFEKNRFIIKLDKYIFKQVCKDIKIINEKIKTTNIINFSINISKEHFAYENFIEEYIKIIKQTNVPINIIELEITESASEYKGINLAKIIENLKNKGFKIALDDFGTGYSSLSMLQELNIDTLKIDKSFIDKLETNSIIKYIIEMSKDLNIKTVAEGVEKKEQVEFLKKMGCDMVQGYYYAKPLNLNEFINYVNNLQ